MAHAKLVRYFYERYLVLGSMRALQIDLDEKQMLAPLRYRVSSKAYGGKPLSRGNLQRILSNPIYLGKMTHFEKVFEGQHPAIIDQALGYGLGEGKQSLSKIILIGILKVDSN